LTNPKGYVAVEFYNPFDTDIKLDGWRLGVIDRRRPTGQPNSADRWKHTIKVFTKTLNGLTIKSNGYLVLDNLGAQTDTEAERARELPPGVQITTGTNSSRAYFYELYKVFEESANKPNKETG